MSTRALLSAAIALAVGLTFATEVRAQWDGPSFLPPQPGEDIGLYLTDPSGADFGLQGIWRQAGNLNLGVRVGFVSRPNDTDILVGAETWGGLFAAGPDFPVDVTWTFGVGALFGDGIVLGIPGGVSIGRTFALAPLLLQVYGHPRLNLAISAVNDQTDLDLDGVFDIGVDVHFNPSWKLRVGITFGGYSAIGVGAAYRFGRGVVVR